jgi:DNA-directed RNA polymerase specialized sigma24 family protein
LALKRRPELQKDERGGSILEELQDPGPSVSDLLEELEEASLLRQTVDAMGGRCRDLLVALFLEDPAPSYERICERLAMPIGSIGPTRARCLRKLQKLLASVSERETRMSIIDETPGRSSELQKEKR